MRVEEKIISVTDGIKAKQLNRSSVLPINHKGHDMDLMQDLKT